MWSTICVWSNLTRLSEKVLLPLDSEGGSAKVLSVNTLTFSQSELHECTFLHRDLLCFIGALQLLAFRSFFAGGKRDERWRRARPRTSGDPRSKWSTKAIVTPGLWYVLGCWHHQWCGFMELMISGRKELFDFCRETIKCFLPES